MLKQEIPSAVADSSNNNNPREAHGVWTGEEHQLFIEGIQRFPSGPWKEIAGFVGTRTARQTMTHAQKYRQKICRRLRHLRANTSNNGTMMMDGAFHKFNSLLSNDEQVGDSIYSTALAIQAERELNVYEIRDDPAMLGRSLSMQVPYVSQGPPPGSLFSYESTIATGDSTNPPHSHGMSEPNESEYEQCIDFLIDALQCQS